MTSKPSPGKLLKPVVLGIDVGTSACKTVVVDAGGSVVATVARAYPTRQRPSGEVTQDPHDWLVAAAATMRECMRIAGQPSVGALSVTAPAHVGVLVDRRGDPLARALLAFDGRPEAVLGRLRREYGASFFDLTGVELTSGWTFPQLVWLRSQLPQATWKRVAVVMLQKDFVRLSMTGAVATDPSDATGAAMVDRATGTWSEPLCEAVGLGLERFPVIEPSLSLAGRLTNSWSRRTGVPAGTPVIVGATDTVGELFSVDALEPGDAIVKIASTGTIVTVTAEARPDRALLTYPHGVAGRWYSAAATNTAATAFNWINDLLAPLRPGEVRSFRRGEAAARRLPPGSEGLLFLPYLEGERVPLWDSRVRGAFVGLSTGHRREHLVRAVMEGVALSLRDCLELMRLVGVRIERPRLTGGGVNSRLWREILVSCLDTDAVLATPHGPAIGAALMAREVVSEERKRPRLRRVEVSRPDGWADSYERLYRIYREAAQSVTRVSHDLVDLTTDRQ